MEVTCPNCESRFNLAADAVKPNSKLRCSVCKNVFTISIPPQGDANTDTKGDSSLDAGVDSSVNLDDGGGLDLDGGSSAKDKAPKSKKSKIILLVIILIILAGGGGGGYWYYTQMASSSQPQDPAMLAKSVELMTMRNVRQYYVQNEKIGPIFVIEGAVVNEFPVPKDLIEVEAAIYGKDKAPLMTKKQLGGTILSLFQLQVLGEEELESFLSNQIEILTKNTNVPTDGEVPFMVLFYNPPADVAEFGVKIISAKDVEQK